MPALTDDLANQLLTQALVMHCHDEPAPGAWLCGRCPYPNAGAVCTKCGAPRYEGTALTGPLVSVREVMHDKDVSVGDRVKHFGQRYTERATATVVGFDDPAGEVPRVLVQPDRDFAYGTAWSADRTEKR